MSDTVLNMKHYLLFNDADTVQIGEPTGFDAGAFVVATNEHYGFDLSYSDGEATYSFSRYYNVQGLTHQFSRLLEQYTQYGWSANVKYILSVVDDSGSERKYVVGQLDFKTCKTDKKDYFEFIIIQDVNEAQLRRRFNSSVNLLSTKTLDDNPIPAIDQYLIYLRAAALEQQSKWELFKEYNISFGGTGGFFGTYLNPLNAIIESGIEDTLTGFIESSDREDFAILQAQNTLTDVTISITDLNYYITATAGSSLGNAFGRLFYMIGTTFDPAEDVEVFRSDNVNLTDGLTYTLEGGEFTIENLTIEKGQKLYLFFEFTVDTQGGTFAAQNTFTSGTVQITSTATSISSTVTAFKLYDVMQYMVRSIGGYKIDAPKFLLNEYKDQYITTASLMRNISTAVNLSFEELLDGLKEFNAGYQVNGEIVFFGEYQDWQQDILLDTFLQAPDERQVFSFDERFGFNTVDLKYKKYEKDNRTDQSREAVHTESQYLMPNKYLEDNLKINIGWIRDRYLIEKVRKEAQEVKADTATENDEDLFIIDCISSPQGFDETLVLYHSSIDSETLELRNDGSINFLHIGLLEGLIINVLLNNAGTYTVTAIEAQKLTLTLFAGSYDEDEGELLTRLSYAVATTTLTNRTDEGFYYFEAISKPDTFSNLRFTQKRVLLNYWGSYIATALYFDQFSKVLTQKYVHNADAVTAFLGEGLIIKEGANEPKYKFEARSMPRITPEYLNTAVLCDFERFWLLRGRVKKERGYIGVKDNLGEVTYIYPQAMRYDVPRGVLEIEGNVRLDTGGKTAQEQEEGQTKYKQILFSEPLFEKGLFR